jgi:hypothetical protein
MTFVDLPVRDLAAFDRAEALRPWRCPPQSPQETGESVLPAFSCQKLASAS